MVYPAISSMSGRPYCGRGGGLSHKRRPLWSHNTPAGQATKNVVQTSGSSCPVRENAVPIDNGSVFLLSSRMAGRFGVRDDSLLCGLLSGTVGRPSLGAAGASGQPADSAGMRGPAWVGGSSHSQQGVDWRRGLSGSVQWLCTLSNTESQTESWQGPWGCSIQPFTVFRLSFPGEVTACSLTTHLQGQRVPALILRCLQISFPTWSKNLHMAIL